MCNVTYKLPPDSAVPLSSKVWVSVNHLCVLVFTVASSVFWVSNNDSAELFGSQQSTVFSIMESLAAKEPDIFLRSWSWPKTEPTPCPHRMRASNVTLDAHSPGWSCYSMWKDHVPISCVLEIRDLTSHIGDQNSFHTFVLFKHTTQFYSVI